MKFIFNVGFEKPTRLVTTDKKVLTTPVFDKVFAIKQVIKSCEKMLEELREKRLDEAVRVVNKMGLCDKCLANAEEYKKQTAEMAKRYKQILKEADEHKTKKLIKQKAKG